jgi:hypothetical protein
VGEVGPWWGVEVTESFGGEEWDPAEEAAALVFVEDVDGGFRGFGPRGLGFWRRLGELVGSFGAFGG